MVRCSENLVLISYRSIFVNSSQNLTPWSCICNFSLVMCSDLGVNSFTAELTGHVEVHFEYDLLNSAGVPYLFS